MTRPTALLLIAALPACATTAPAALVAETDAGAQDALASGVEAAPEAGPDVVADADIAPDFASTEVLGRPAASSIGVSAIPRSDLEVYFEYGVSAGEYSGQTAAAVHPGGQPFVVSLEGLAADTQYHYRMRWRPPGAPSFGAGPDRAFHTARPGAFVFTMQADPHLDEVSSLELYQRTLDNQLADAPDFMIDLGDTFMCEKHSVPFDATVQAAQDPSVVAARYAFEHANFARVAHSLPLLLVNGNHEGEAGWLLNGTADNLAVWATLARKAHFPVPFADAFFAGSETEVEFVGKRASWYAWTWGGALFVVLDPHWFTMTKAKTDLWVWTLGAEQYGWLRDTLQKSKEPFRFVLIHNLLGGLDSQGRGGVETAPYYEWGGANADGTPGFATQRPGWDKPVHQLLVENHVTAVFHGHDHVYVKQELDGIVYQELPQPSAPTFNNGAQLAAKQGYTSGVIVSSSGHLRVSVKAGEAKVEYVRAYRPQDEGADAHNGDVGDSYTMVPR